MIMRFVSAWMRRLEALSWVGLCLFAGFWLAWLSWLRPLTLPDEGRYAGVAWEMLRAGDRAVPLLNGLPFFHKPPLYYWLAEASFQVFGVHAWSARLPSWLAAWAAVMGVYAFMRRYRGRTSATVSLLVLVTQPFFYGASQFANLDMLVAGMITLTTLAGAATVLRFNKGEAWRWFAIATAALAGLGVLSKGLIGVVLPGGILLIWILSVRNWRALRALLWPPAIIAFFAVCLPWFWIMQEEFSNFFNYFFIYQQFDRFAEATFNNRQPFWFYFPVVAGLILPWTFWLGAVFRREFWSKDDSEAYTVRLLMAIWTMLVLVFFSIPASKLVGYVLPALPPLGILVAEVIAAGLQRGGAGNTGNTGRGYRASFALAACLCVLGVALATIYAKPNSMPLARSARAEFQPGDQVVMLHSYAYDLPMGLRDPRPAWVVDDWNNPTISMRDNWRKELYDAGQFSPNAMKETLISFHELKTRICGAPPGNVFWIMGEPEWDRDQPFLRGLQPVGISGKRALWRVVSDVSLKAKYCGEVASIR